MDKYNDFSSLLSSYFLKHLPSHTGYSRNTVSSYRDTFVLLFRYHEQVYEKKASTIQFSCITKEYIEAFLVWLETERSYTASSRNQRLAAIHAFFRYVLMDNPAYMEQCQSILSIRVKKAEKKPVDYISIQGIRLLLEMPDRMESAGRRDLALLALMYDSGARVQEIADLRTGDIQLQKPYTVKVTGKGNKTRIVPLMPQTANIIKNYLSDTKQISAEMPLFYSYSGKKLTRAGIAYILKKYVRLAREQNPVLYPDKVSPHTLRHSKSMHLLEGGVNLVYIRDFLGHSSITTTEIYARANPEIKRKAIEEASASILPEEKFDRQEKADLIAWLKELI